MGLPRDKSKLVGIVAGFLLLWLVLDTSATLLRSFRGEAGLIVCLAVIAAGLALELLFFEANLTGACRRLGLAMPNGSGLLAAILLCIVLLLFFPCFAAFTGTSMRLDPDWLWLAPGLFAQGGLAEEIVFRGYLFGHIRVGRSFWRAALVATVPFVAVHLLLFATLDPALAAASLVLSVSISFPLAWLFERSGNSVWPPALVHFVIQGAIKLVDVDDEAMAGMAVAWIVLASVLPWSLFLLLRDRPAGVHARLPLEG